MIIANKIKNVVELNKKRYLDSGRHNLAHTRRKIKIALSTCNKEKVLEFLCSKPYKSPFYNKGVVWIYEFSASDVERYFGIHIPIATVVKNYRIQWSGDHFNISQNTTIIEEEYL